MRLINWGEMLPETLGPNQMVAAFKKYTTSIIDRLFPLQTIRKSSNEDHWITNGMSRYKKRIYKREGKSRAGIALGIKISGLLAASKEKFVESSMVGGDSTRTYFSAVKKLASAAAPQPWSLLDLYPNRSPLEAGNETAAFFTRISDIFEPFGPLRDNNKREPVTVEHVTALLKRAKKPKSSVRGDILPRLVKAHHASI